MFSRLRRQAEPEITTLRIGHAAECARLHGCFFAHPWGVNEFETLIASASVYGAVAIIPEKKSLTGFILVRRAADEAEILTIAVDKSAQKKGLGRKLLTHQKDELQRAGVKRLFLEVDEGNKAARHLYSTSGFAQAGVRPGYYRGQNGQPANALILVSDLA